MSDRQKKGAAPFTFVYKFNASKKAVFNAFSNAEALNEWWGPVETRNSVVKLDFRPGGIFHYKMESDKGTAYGRFLFGKIEPYDLLEFSNAFVDVHAKVVKAPFEIPLPREIFYRLRFSEKKGKTTISMTGEPVDPTLEQTKGFESIGGSMEQGFGATFNKLSAYLAKQKSP